MRQFTGIILEFSERDILQMNRNFVYVIVHLMWLTMRSHGKEPIWFFTHNDRGERKAQFITKGLPASLYRNDDKKIMRDYPWITEKS